APASEYRLLFFLSLSPPHNSELHFFTVAEPQDTSKETGEEEEAGSDSSGLQVEETSVLTNGEISEEEEDVLEHKSILPSSVLDQASVIAERFISSLSRRSSLVSEDLGSLACPSPSTDNDLFKSPSACMDLEKQTQMLASSTPEPQETSEANLSTPAHEPALDAVIEGERRSTLSKQDRLLIHKIRRYYEHAEHQDANFSIKRRESLSYIPAGLVRYLSRQLNSVPQEQAAPVHRKGLSRNRPTSWSVFDLPGLEKNRNTETQEEFRPSSDMLKVWQDMEMEEESQEVQQIEEEESPQILEESEISTASDSSSISSPNTTSPAVEGGSGEDPEPSNATMSQEKNHVNHDQLPKLISFRTSVDEDQILQDMGKMKNKVFQLARQYSQRIKNNRPIEAIVDLLSLTVTYHLNSCMDKTEKHSLFFVYIYAGKPSVRLPLIACDEMVIHEVRSPSPVRTPSSGASSQSTVTCPQSPQSETFYWPDVQELRSKYIGPSHFSKLTRSCTTGMLECCANMYNGCSQKCNSSLDLHKALTDCPRTQSAVEDWSQTQPRFQPLLCRWSSLDHMLGSLPLNEVQNLQEPVRTCYTAGKLHDGDILSQDDLDCAANSAVGSSGKTSESNLVKSLREKFQSLSTSS
uniref:Uncharacterized protein n=1 Tax=Seriola lalandi dorsalis TaxID=1841481 RepID=A0A3B4WPX3_SERLL